MATQNSVRLFQLLTGVSVVLLLSSAYFISITRTKTTTTNLESTKVSIENEKKQYSKPDLNSIVNFRKSKPSVCISNDSIYFGQLTHNNNLGGQMKNMYETVQTRTSVPFLKKNNTFIFTDTTPSQEMVNLFERATLKSSPNNLQGYGGAQKRFLESIFTMLDIKKQRNDTNVKWFMISDDDHMSIPYNFMKTFAKFELKLKKGELSNSEPFLIGRTLDTCTAVSGGASVIFNEKMIELLRVKIDECIAKFGLSYYDLTIYRCVDEVITSKSSQEKCKILKHEPTMHCCNYMYFCDPSSYDDPPNLSWFNRFRNAFGLHYIGGHHIQRMKEWLPEHLFTNVEQCFPVEELEQDLRGYMPKFNNDSLSDLNNFANVMERVKNLGPKPEIDWMKPESHQQNRPAVTMYMTNLVNLIYASWENHFASDRIQIVNNLEKNDVAIIIIPSSHVESRARLISNNYNLQESIQSSQQYWKGLGFPLVHICIPDNTTTTATTTGELESLISLYSNCFKETQLNFRWTLVVTESTRMNVPSFINYLKTFDDQEPLFIGAMSSAFDLIISQLDVVNNDKKKQQIGLPFGALFSISKSFVQEFISIESSSDLSDIEKQEKINSELLVPNKKMKLSGGQFFKQAPEHYCTKGIQNLDSWIEMQVPTKFLEPLSVTFPPTNNCPGRMQSIDQFFNKVRNSVVSSTCF